jgi:hypothetical protein
MREKQSLRVFKHIQFWRLNLRKRSLGRPRKRRKDTINMHVQEMGLGRDGVDCSGLGYGHVVDACERGNEHSGSMKCGEFLD